jgi:hypothetical protein
MKSPGASRAFSFVRRSSLGCARRRKGYRLDLGQNSFARGVINVEAKHATIGA